LGHGRLLIHVLSEAELDSVEIHYDNPEGEGPNDCCIEVVMSGGLSVSVAARIPDPLSCPHPRHS